MNNFNNIRFPQYRTSPTHKILTKTVLYEGDEAPIVYDIATTGMLELEVGTPVILIEDQIGIGYQWCKVSVPKENGKEGYVLKNNIIVLTDNIPKMFELVINGGPLTLEQTLYIPNKNEVDENWRSRPSNRVFEDKKRSVFYVMYDTGKQQLDTDFPTFMEEALYKGMAIILKTQNISYDTDIQYLKKLQSENFNFAAAEAIDSSFRICSSIRVLVSIPVRYVRLRPFKIVEQRTRGSSTALDFEIIKNSIPGDIANSISTTQTPTNLQSLKFYGSDEFQQFFDRLATYEEPDLLTQVIPINWRGGILNIARRIYKTREWKIEDANKSDVSVDFDSEINSILNLKNALETLILYNTPKELIIGLDTLDPELEEFRKKFPTVPFANHFAMFRRTNTKLGWRTNVEILVDTEKLEIVNVSLANNTVNMPINNYFFDFLLNPSIKNKTSINYLLNSYSRQEQFIGTESKLSITDFFELSEEWRTSPLIAPVVGLSSVAGIKGPDADLSKFVVEYHFPKVEKMYALPLNLSNCISTNVSTLKSLTNKTKSEIIKFQNDKRKLIDSNEIIKSDKMWITGLLNDDKLSLSYEKVVADYNSGPGSWVSLTNEQFYSNVFGREAVEIVKDLTFNSDRYKELWESNELEKKFQAISEVWVPSFMKTNLMQIFSILVACYANGNLSQQQFIDLLKNYNNVKAYLENLAYSTICNPTVTSFINKLNELEIPDIPTYDPNRNLIDEIGKLWAKAIGDLLKSLISAGLQNLARYCNPFADPTRPGSQPAVNNVLDNLNNRQDDISIDDILGDLFEQPNPDLPPGDLEQLKQKNREKFNNLFKDLSCFLTTRELCELLQSPVVNLGNDVYELIENISKNKYGMTKLSNKEEINNFFKIIGSKIDVQICDELDKLPESPILCGCDDMVLDNARRKILSDKNLPPNVIDDIIRDLNDEALSNLDKALKILNDPSPIDLTKIPSGLCGDDPNSPVSNLMSPSLDDFKKTLDSIFKPVYETFNSEAANWKIVNYSISSSHAPNFTFDTGSGVINLANSDGSATTPEKKYKIPSYLFKNQLLDSSMNYTNYEFSSSIDGYKQLQLDANILSTELRQQTDKANKELSAFLSRFIGFVANWFNIVVGGIGGTAGAANYLSTVLNDTNIKSQFVDDLLNFMKVFDSFARLNEDQYAQISGSEQIINKFVQNNVAQDLFIKENGISTTYLRIMEFLSDGNGSTLPNVIDSFVGNFGETNQKLSDFKSLDGGIYGRLAEDLKQQFTTILDTYNKLKNYYSVVAESNIVYPKYDVLYEDNLKISNITNQTASNNYYSLKIRKNDLSYISINDYEKMPQSINSKIGLLGYSSSSYDKKNIYKEYSNDLKDENSNNLSYLVEYRDISQYIFNKCSASLLNVNNERINYINTKNSDYLNPSLCVVETSSNNTASYFPLTDEIALVLRSDEIPSQTCVDNYHYLQINDIKKSMSENKQKNNCIDSIVNKYVRENKDIPSQELKDLEINDTQEIMLAGSHRLTLRMFLHDIILRGMVVFGRYDPQYLRDDALFIEFLSAMVESEMRGMDNNYYVLMTSFFVKMHNKMYPNNVLDTNSNIHRRSVLKTIISDELRKNVLPILSKRLYVETNKRIEKLVTNCFGGADNYPTYELNNIKKLADLSSVIGLDIEFEQKENMYFIKITNEYKIPILKGIKGNDVNLPYNPIDFSLVFEYLFPIKRYITLLFIQNVLNTSTRKQILNTFNGTKKTLMSITKKIYANGQEITPDPENPQEMEDATSNYSAELLNFILKAFVQTPLSIAKGFIETTDPNVALASTSYKIVKLFKPDITSFLVPGFGVGWGFAGVPPLIYGILYYVLGLWYEDDTTGNPLDAQEKQKRKLVENILSTKDTNALNNSCTTTEIQLDSNSTWNKSN